MIGEMWHRAKTMNEWPQQIVASVISKAHSNVAAILPKKDSLKRTICLILCKNDTPALPSNLQNLMIPQRHQEFVIEGNAQKFLMYDSQDELLPHRMLIF